MRPSLMLVGGSLPAGDRRRKARADMRQIAERIARAIFDGQIGAPMILEDAAALAAIVLAYTEGEA